MLYGSDTWPINAKVTRLINSSATSAYRVMTSEKRMNKVRNSTVLARHDHCIPVNYVSLGIYYVQTEHSMHFLGPRRVIRLDVDVLVVITSTTYSK